MASHSFVSFSRSLTSGTRIRETATDARLRPISHEAKRVFFHASLAAHVAAWDSYLNNVVREFLEATRKPLDPEYSAAHAALEGFVERSLQRFNTPNAENSRTLLVDCTGYDPINDWNWPRGRLNATETRELLNQVLKVRHSFAHGFEIPGYEWTTTPSGQRRLTAKALERIEAFLLHLAKVSDRGLALHARSMYPSCSGRI